MFRKAILPLLSLFILPGLSLASTIRGQIIATSDRFAAGMEVVLKQRGRADLKTMPNDAGKYEFHDLQNGHYDIIVRSKGKEVRRTADLACGPEGVAVVDIVLDRNDTPSLNVYFPVDDPDIADVAQLKRDYPKDVLRDYDNARQDALGGNYGRAAQRLESVVQRAPDFYNAHSRLGMVYQQLGCYPEAQREYTAARDLSPRSAQPLVNLASLFIQSADAGIGDDALENARNALLQAIKIKSSAIAYCLLGSVDFKAGKYEDAEQNLKQALTIQSHMVAARLMLANLYLRQEKWDAALQQLDSYLQENPLATDYDQVKKMRDRLSANK